MVSEQRVIQSEAADYYCLSRKFSCLCKNFIVRGSQFILFIYYETVETF